MCSWPYRILAILLMLMSLLVSVPATAAVGPPTVASLTLNPTTVTGGAPLIIIPEFGRPSALGTVTLSGPAPAGGLTLGLSSSNSAVATVPASVTVVAGQTTAKFPIGTYPVASPTTVTISASQQTRGPTPQTLPTLVTRTAALTVIPPVLSSLTCTPTSVTVLHIVACTVTLTGLVASGGQVVVALQSSNPNVAEPPNQVYVLETQSSAQFTVGTKLSSSGVVIYATYGGVGRGATLTVLPLLISSLTCTPIIVTGGNPVGCTVILTDLVASGYHDNVTLSSSNMAVATVPWGVPFSAGQNSASFVVTTKPVRSSTPVTISALLGVTKTVTLKVNPVRPASLSRVLIGGLTAISLLGPRPDVGVGMGGHIELYSKAQQGGADGVITVDEIYSYVSKKVPEVTGQNQNPVKKGEVEGQLILGRVR